MAYPVEKIPGLGVEDIPRYTIKQWESWEGKWELIDGYPFAMTPAPSKKHQRISRNLERIIGNALDNCKHCEVLPPINLRVNDETIVHPDLVVTCNEPMNGLYLETIPIISIEIISPSSLRHDRFTKPKVYAAIGVRYYILIDPAVDSLEVFELTEGSYQEVALLNNATFTFELQNCEANIDFSKIWP